MDVVIQAPMARQKLALGIALGKEREKE